MTDPKLEALVEAGTRVVDWLDQRARDQKRGHVDIDNPLGPHLETLRTALAAIEPSPEPSAEEVARKLVNAEPNYDAPASKQVTWEGQLVTALTDYRAAGARDERSRVLVELDRLMVEARQPVWLAVYSEGHGVSVYDSKVEGADSACLVNTQIDALIAGLQVFLSPTPGGSDDE